MKSIKFYIIFSIIIFAVFGLTFAFLITANTFDFSERVQAASFFHLFEDAEENDEEVEEEPEAEEENDEEEAELEDDDKGVSFILEVENTKVSSGDSIDAKLKLKNNTENTHAFSFRTGQKFDLELLDEDGESVYKWSRGQVFTQAEEILKLESGEKETWSASIRTAELRRGEYTLNGWLTDAGKSLQTESLSVTVE